LTAECFRLTVNSKSALRPPKRLRGSNSVYSKKVHLARCTYIGSWANSAEYFEASTKYLQLDSGSASDRNMLLYLTGLLYTRDWLMLIVGIVLMTIKSVRRSIAFVVPDRSIPLDLLLHPK
jgi:hypothetical protein